MGLSCFKAYDIRGKIPEELSVDLATKIAMAYALVVLDCTNTPEQTVVVGRDVRLESPSIAVAIIDGLVQSGVHVLDIGECGTEEVYFATFHHRLAGGIMVTASHNPKGYNGLKLVREGSRPVSGDTGLKDIERYIENGEYTKAKSDTVGTVRCNVDKTAYLDHILSYVDVSTWRPMHIVMNPGNGAGGVVLPALIKRLPCVVTSLHVEPDGNFPHGVPNPLLVENRKDTASAVIASRADFGIAWDGDFDRCFFFDHQGNCIEGYYIVGLLAEMLLQKHPASRIIHDPRLTWNTIDIVEKMGGIPLQTKTGHAFIKERMRKEDAIYGGEMSAHHYFREFAYCDSGMIPWLLVAELISVSNTSLADLVSQRMEMYPCSGEINFTVHNSTQVITAVQEFFLQNMTEEPKMDRTDGLSIEFSGWRMNIRSSNTEPLLRVNIESRGDKMCVENVLQQVQKIIQAMQ